MGCRLSPLTARRLTNERGGLREYWQSLHKFPPVLMYEQEELSQSSLRCRGLLGWYTSPYRHIIVLVGQGWSLHKWSTHLIGIQRGNQALPLTTEKASSSWQLSQLCRSSIYYTAKLCSLNVFMHIRVSKTPHCYSIIANFPSTEISLSCIFKHLHGTFPVIWKSFTYRKWDEKNWRNKFCLWNGS